jgi:hypothetical protein
MSPVDFAVEPTAGTIMLAALVVLLRFDQIDLRRTPGGRVRKVDRLSRTLSRTGMVRARQRGQRYDNGIQRSDTISSQRQPDRYPKRAMSLIGSADCWLASQKLPCSKKP